ncbi:component of the polarisome [Coemansia sp. RSA 989]|nr:component of the polarisome [Coemansia sp. RSA 1821]KAJ1868465.1 component of the polarisome [Coemansia sp. RSA 989]
MEDRAVQYHREMSRFIMEEVDDGVQPPSNLEAGKLARLSLTQFKELGTDVYDELIRRTTPEQGLPFLPVRDHYHPKRNQARQKLATLSRPKFVNLVHDVDEELKRRFPHKLDVQSSYPASSHASMHDSPSTSPVYSNHGSQQYQKNDRSPPASMGRYHSQNAEPAYSAQRKPSNEEQFGGIDRAANDLNRTLHGQPARVPSGEARGVYSPADDVEKVRHEYEMRLSAMRKRVGQLESQLLDCRGDNPNGPGAAQMENLERLNAVLTQKNERMENDLRILRDQLVAAKADIPALRQENDRLKHERSQFIERERDLKSKLDEARATIRRLKSTSVFAMDHGDADIVPPPVFVNSGGAIRPSSVRTFQEAVELLLSAGRSDHAEHELPIAQSAVAAAVDGLRADVRGYEAAHAQDPHSWPLPDDTKDAMPDIMDALDINLHKLATAVDKHLGSMGVLPISLLEAAASHLATSVVDLVKLLKVCFDESKAAPRVAATTERSLEQSTDSIIAGIQSMLQLVREAVPDPNALFSTLHSVIESIRATIGICRDQFDKIESGAGAQINSDLYDPRIARDVLSGLEKGNLQLTDQLNDITEAQEAAGDSDLDNEIVRELLGDMAFKQGLASALVDVGKLTKTLVVWLE